MTPDTSEPETHVALAKKTCSPLTVLKAVMVTWLDRAATYEPFGPDRHLIEATESEIIRAAHAVAELENNPPVDRCDAWVVDG